MQGARFERMKRKILTVCIFLIVPFARETAMQTAAQTIRRIFGLARILVIVGRLLT